MEAKGFRENRFYGRRKGKKLKPSRVVLLDSFLPRVRLRHFDADETVDPRTLFSVPVRDVWLEVGFGGGEHLAEQSRRRPDVGFIGAEVFINGVTSLLTHLTGTQSRGASRRCSGTGGATSSRRGGGYPDRRTPRRCASFRSRSRGRPRRAAQDSSSDADYSKLETDIPHY